MKPNSRFFTIQQVSSQCGVSKSTLRFWESKFRTHMFPDRSKGGQRRYAVGHFAVIARIKRLKADGLSLEEIDTLLSSGPVEEASPAERSLDHLAERIAGLVKEEIYQFLFENGLGRGGSGSGLRSLHGTEKVSLNPISTQD
jgi:DNA-binding transcriptional MerR regulator